MTKPRRLTRSITLTLILSILIIQLIKKSNSFNCNDIKSCSCDKSPDRGYDLNCPDNWNTIIKVSFDFDTQNALEIECRDLKANYLNMLPTNYLPEDIPQLNLTSLRFKFCNLPFNTTVRDVMNHLKIVETKMFRIIMSDLRNLTRKDLAGLENVKFLEVIGNTFDKNIDSDLLYDMENLEVIDFKGNNVVIPQDFFLYAPNLKNIEIAENYLPQNTTGLFSTQRKLKHLNMWSMKIQTLSSDIFNGCENLVTIDLNNNRISNLPLDLFKHLPNLKEISLRRNLFKTLPEGIFKNNPKLEVVRLEENLNLNSLPENLFAHKPNLKNVTLYLCNLTSIPESLFNDSNSLEKIDLSENKIEFLPINLLRLKSKLRVLNLSKNRITNLRDDFFKDLTSLEYLLLSDNPNLILTSNNFDKLNNLRELDLRNNTLKILNPSFRNLEKLIYLDLSYNELTLMDTFNGQWSPLSELKNLEELNLQRNNISVIFNDWKFTLNHLKKIDLSNNSFTTLSYNDFAFTQEDITINLENNQITWIDFEDAEDLKRIEELSHNVTKPRSIYEKRGSKIIQLNNNPLHCDCHLYDLYRYFDLTIAPEVRASVEIKADQLYCNSPDNMQGTLVNTIKSRKFVCEFDNNKVCPELATCYYQPFGKVLRIDLSSKGLTEVPLLKAFMNESKKLTFKKNIVMLQENNITEMPRPGMGYEKIHHVDLSKNFISNVDWVPQNLEVLLLNDNKLTHLDDKTLSIFNNSQLSNLSLYNNPWTCNCSTVGFLKFIQENFEKLDKMQYITCHKTNQVIKDLTSDELCPLPTYLIIFLCVFVAFIGIFVAILTFLYNRYNMEIKVWLYAHQQCLWLVTEEEIDRDKIYDAFISYSHKDEDFIIPELIEKLESEPNSYKLCLHFRNWQPGEFISKNIANSIADSKRTIVILSKNFLESEWGKMEFRVAHKQALEENRARVIIILYGEIPFENLDDEIKAYLNTNTYLKWGDPWFWDKLRYALPHSHVKNYQVLEKVAVTNEKDTDFCNVPSTPSQTTPPIDKIININNDPLKLNDALNVKLVNGTLVNGFNYPDRRVNENQFFGANVDLYDCYKNNERNLESNLIIR